MSRQRTLVTFVALAALVIALPVAADVGSFQSFTATTTHPTNDSIQWDFTLQTQGATVPGTLDTVTGTLGFSRIDAPSPYPPTNYTYITLQRTGPTANTFATTFTATGLDSRIDYKWGAAVYYIDSPTLSAFLSLVGQLSPFYYSNVLPFFYSFVNTAVAVVNANNVDAPGGVNFALRLGRVVSLGRGIPTTSAVGVVLLGLLMMGAGVLVIRRS